MEEKEHYKAKRDKVLRNLSTLIYIITLALIGLSLWFNISIDIKWIFVLLGLFAFINYFRDFLTNKSWTLLGFITFSLLFVIGLILPNVGAIIYKTINALLGWVFLILIFVGLGIGVHRIYKRIMTK